MKEVKLHVESLDEFARRSRDMARRLDGGSRKRGTAHVSFESMEGFLKALTPNRWRLLRKLRGAGPSSIRALAKALERDYRGVHADVIALIDVGLIERGSDNSICVPFAKITAEMAFEDAA